MLLVSRCEVGARRIGADEAPENPLGSRACDCLAVAGATSFGSRTLTALRQLRSAPPPRNRRCAVAAKRAVQEELAGARALPSPGADGNSVRSVSEAALDLPSRRSRCGAWRFTGRSRLLRSALDLGRAAAACCWGVARFSFRRGDARAQATSPSARRVFSPVRRHEPSSFSALENRPAFAHQKWPTCG